MNPTSNATSRAFRRGIGLAFLAIGAMAFGGCARNGGMDEESAFEIENRELRAQLEQVNAALNAAEDRAGTLEGEVIRLERDRDDLSRRLSEANQPRLVEPAAGSSGFEGIGNVDVLTRGGEVVVDIAADVLFASGSATLRNDAKQTLDQVASVLNGQYASNELRIAGHSDRDPIRKSSWKTNERLSAERALSVEEYLATRGVSKDRMYVAAYGPAKPRETKAKSRRVEIVIVSR